MPCQPEHMIEIDASMGEGGGQVLRYSLAIAAITRRSVRLRNVRAKRDRPGLQMQHLAAVRVLAEITRAQVRGDRLGSTELEFRPSGIFGGRYEVDVGTAGSLTLVLQSALPVLAFADARSELLLRGGTDVPRSPTFDYFSSVFLEHLRRMSYDVELELIRRGHYPRGGGEVRARVRSMGALRPLRIDGRGGLLEIGGRSHATELPRHVAERQARAAEEELRKRGADVPVRLEIEVSGGAGRGSGIALWARTENSILGSDALGERGKPAELVGREAARLLMEDLATGAALDRHASDMLVPYLMFADGRSEVSGSSLTSHARTVIELARLIAPEIALRVEGGDRGGPFRLTVEGQRPPPAGAPRLR
ncbi:MAG: RNA 3'-terminal phosphate cyclase [Conexivisphaera sp.]